MVKLILVIQKNLLSLTDYFYSLYSINETKQNCHQMQHQNSKNQTLARIQMLTYCPHQLYWSFASQILLQHIHYCSKISLYLHRWIS